MRKRFQKGSLKNVDGSWIAQWWDDGHRRKRTLGRVSKMSKTQAVSELAEILAPINARQITPSRTYMFGEFVAAGIGGYSNFPHRAHLDVSALAFVGNRSQAGGSYSYQSA